MTEEPWATVDNVAAHLKVTRDTIYRWIDRRGFPVHRVGRILRFRISEVDRCVEQGGGAERKDSRRKRK
jgi:excisionase family DNA binding protein